MREDYYELLDVEKTASEREIRAAYRRLAMQLHPDHNDGNAAAEERFKLVCEAWRTLGHVDLRADYDGVPVFLRVMGRSESAHVGATIRGSHSCAMVHVWECGSTLVCACWD